MSQHKNSKKVWLRRTDTFLDAVQTQAKEFMSMSRKSLGSFWESSTSRVVGTGLNFNEQKLLLPNIVDFEPEDREFRKAVTKYYKDIRTTVPAGDGLELEIGLELGNDKPLGWKDPETGFVNIPIKISDYLKYRHAKAHPLCASSYNESLGNQNIMFFVYDPDVEEKVVAEDTAQRDEAMLTYLQIKDKPEKVDGMLLLMGVDIRDYAGPNAPVLKSSRLRVLAETRAVDFNQFYKIDNFEMRSRIEGFIKVGLFRRVGERIVDASNNKVIGNNMREVIDLLADNPEYKEQMALWLGSYQEAIAKPTLVKRGTKKATA